MPGYAFNSGKIAKLANLIASGSTQKDAAFQVGFCERTAVKYCTQPEFRAKVAAIRQGYVEQGMGRLSASVTAAASVLIRLMQSDNETTRLRAAEILLDKALRFREVIHLEAEVADLKARMDDVSRSAAVGSTAAAESNGHSRF